MTTQPRPASPAPGHAADHQPGLTLNALPDPLSLQISLSCSLRYHCHASNKAAQIGGSGAALASVRNHTT